MTGPNKNDLVEIVNLGMNPSLQITYTHTCWLSSLERMGSSSKTMPRVAQLEMSDIGWRSLTKISKYYPGPLTQHTPQVSICGTTLIDVFALCILPHANSSRCGQCTAVNMAPDTCDNLQGPYWVTPSPSRCSPCCTSWFLWMLVGGYNNVTWLCVTKVRNEWYISKLDWFCLIQAVQKMLSKLPVDHHLCHYGGNSGLLIFCYQGG